MEKRILQFEVGKIYGMHSLCDYDCQWFYLVVRRTKTTVTLVQVKDKVAVGHTNVFRINKAISQLRGAEAVRPLGTYSMCPTLTAE